MESVQNINMIFAVEGGARKLKNSFLTIKGNFSFVLFKKSIPYAQNLWKQMPAFPLLKHVKLQVQ